MERPRNWIASVELGDKEAKAARNAKYRKVLEALGHGEKGQQQLTLSQLRKLQETNPCGAVFIALGRMTLSNAVLKAFKEWDLPRRHLILQSAVEEALSLYLEGAIGKCRSMGCLIYAAGLLADLHLLPLGHEFRDSCLRRLENFYMPTNRSDEDFKILVDPIVLDNIKKGILSTNWPLDEMLVAKNAEPLIYFNFLKLSDALREEEKVYGDIKKLMAVMRDPSGATRILIGDEPPIAMPIEARLAIGQFSLPENLKALLNRSLDVYLGLPFVEEDANKKAQSATLAKKKSRNFVTQQKENQAKLLDAEARAAKVAAYLEKCIEQEAPSAAADASITDGGSEDQVNALLDLTKVDAQKILKMAKDGSKARDKELSWFNKSLELIKERKIQAMYFQLPGVEQISDEAGSSPKLLVTLEEVDGQLKSVKEEEIKDDKAIADIMSQLSSFEASLPDKIERYPEDLSFPDYSPGVLMDGDIDIFETAFIEFPPEVSKNVVNMQKFRAFWLQEKYKQATRKDRLLPPKAAVGLALVEGMLNNIYVYAASDELIYAFHLEGSLTEENFDGFVTCLNDGIRGHLVLEALIGQRSAADVQQIAQACEAALRRQLIQEKPGCYKKAVVHHFAQDDAQVLRITKAMEVLETAIAETFDPYWHDPLPLLTKLLLGLLPPNPKDATPEEIEAHVVAIKGRLSRSILLFLSRLNDAGELDDYMFSSIEGLLLPLLTNQGYFKDEWDIREILEDKQAKLCEVIFAGLGRIELFELVSIYAFVAQYIGSRQCGQILLPELADIEAAIENDIVEAVTEGSTTFLKLSKGGLATVLTDNAMIEEDDIPKPVPALAAQPGKDASSGHAENGAEKGKGKVLLPPVKKCAESMAKLVTGVPAVNRTLKDLEAQIKQQQEEEAMALLASQEARLSLPNWTPESGAAKLRMMEKFAKVLDTLLATIDDCRLPIDKAARDVTSLREMINQPVCPPETLYKYLNNSKAILEDVIPHLEASQKADLKLRAVNAILNVIEARGGWQKWKRIFEEYRLQLRKEKQNPTTTAERLLELETHALQAQETMLSARRLFFLRQLLLNASVGRLNIAADGSPLAKELTAVLSQVRAFMAQYPPGGDKGIPVSEVRRLVTTLLIPNFEMLRVHSSIDENELPMTKSKSVVYIDAAQGLALKMRNAILNGLEFRPSAELAHFMVRDILGQIWQDSMAKQVSAGISDEEDDFVGKGSGGPTKSKKKKAKKKGGKKPTPTARISETEEAGDEFASATSSSPQPSPSESPDGGDLLTEGQNSAPEPSSKDKAQDRASNEAAAAHMSPEAIMEAQIRQQIKEQQEYEARAAAAAAARRRELEQARGAAAGADEQPGTPVPEREQEAKSAEAEEESAVIEGEPTKKKEKEKEKEEEEEDVWQEAKPHRKQHQAQHVAAPDPDNSRFISWLGVWKCGVCGKENDLRSSCTGCREVEPPCVVWCLGRCRRRHCQYRHLRFDLVSMGEKPMHWPKGMALAEPNEDFIWGKPRRKSAAATTIAVPRPLPVAPLSAAPAAPAAGRTSPAPPLSPARKAAAIPAVRFTTAASATALPSQVTPRGTAPAQIPQQQPTRAGPAMSAMAPPSYAVPAVPVHAAPQEDLDAMMEHLGIRDAYSTGASAEHQNGWGSSQAAGMTLSQSPASFAAAVGPLETVWPAPGEDQEDAELKAALEASLRDQTMLEEVRAAAAAAVAAEWSAYSSSSLRNAAETSGIQSRESSAAAPGLTNEIGEYNCFLNVVVQCLWHCSEFRAAVMSWPPEIYQADPVVHALRNLFSSLADSQAPTGRAVVNPSELREALASIDARFATRQMADAAELLEQVFEQIAVACATAGVPSAVDPVFGLCVTEEVTCSACKHTTHHRQFIQHWLTAAATALRMMAGEAPTPGLGALLRLLHDQERKTCDKEESGCGAWNPVNHFLDVNHPPAVFTLQLAWESHAEESFDIAGSLSTLTEHVDLADVYKAVEKGALQYRLRALVAYYGQHYQAFVRPPGCPHGPNHWVMVDDARAVDVGDWNKVVAKCQAGKIQPSVLFFERERSSNLG